MKYRNAFVFIAVIMGASLIVPQVVLGGLFAWDAVLLYLDPTAGTTISVQFSDLCYAYPVIPSVMCFVLGLDLGLGAGLVLMFISHTMWNVGTPAMRAALAQVADYAARIAHLEAVAAQARNEADEAEDDYDREVVAHEMLKHEHEDALKQLADCRAASFPRLHTES